MTRALPFRVYLQLKAFSRHPHNPTQQHDRVERALLGDKTEPHFWFFAKKRSLQQLAGQWEQLRLRSTQLRIEPL